jgi:hypothetical protein
MQELFYGDKDTVLINIFLIFVCSLHVLELVYFVLAIHKYLDASVFHAISMLMDIF